MLTIIIISILLFIFGFIIGYLYKKSLYQKQKPIIPNLPIHQPKYIHFDIPEDLSIEQLKENLRKIQLEISIHPLTVLKYAKFPYSEFERLQKEYKELKLKELSLMEKINKIN
jgi:hypothetical protein